MTSRAQYERLQTNTEQNDQETLFENHILSENEEDFDENQIPTQPHTHEPGYARIQVIESPVTPDHGYTSTHTAQRDSSVPAYPAYPTANTALPGSFPTTTLPQTIRIQQQERDGVFSNISAKPSTQTEDPKSPDTPTGFQLPPTYSEAVAETEEIPTYYETTIITHDPETNELLVEGAPVGSFSSFVVNMVIVFAFEFVGFLLCMMVSRTHASRSGAKAGLGVVFLRFGMIISSKLHGARMGETPSDDDTYNNPHNGNVWIGYISMFIGFWILTSANIEFLRVRKLESIAKSTSAVVYEI